MKRRGEEISAQRRRKLVNLKLVVKWKTGRRRGGKGGAGRYHRLGRYLFAPLFILSWDEVALPAQVVWIWETSWIKHDEKISPPVKHSSFFFRFRGSLSSRLAASPFLLLFNVMSGVCLLSLQFFFSLCPSWPSTWITPHSFICWLSLFLSSLGCPRQSLLLRPSHLCTSLLLYLYFLLTQQLCSSLPLSDYPCLFICLPFFLMNLRGTALSVSFFLRCFLNLSQLFLSGCLILGKASKGEKQSAELIPNPVSKWSFKKKGK